MKLEEILPQIRDGMKARRAVWSSGLFHTDSSLGLKHGDILAEDWELVPRKYELWINLYPGYGYMVYPSKEQADRLAADNRLECRMIEWEAPQ